LNERAREHGLPLGLVALDDEKAVGTIALVAQGTASHAQLSPWAAGLWVEPSRRREGIGAKLLEAACAQARAEAHANVYASTANSARLFDRHGWTKIAVGTTFGGDSVDIFCKKLERNPVRSDHSLSCGESCRTPEG
jgi:predicted N-acetyltransferase YhbS